MSFGNFEQQLLKEFNEKLGIKEDIKTPLQKTIKINNLKEEIYKKQNINKNSDFILRKNSTKGIDRNLDKKLSKGEIHFDYTLDLHGLTIQEAYEKLYQLFNIVEIKQYRCLLIITGKGIHSTIEKPIKDHIEDWFSETFFSNKIIKYTNAIKKHGGEGALYVLLRKTN